MFFCDRIGRRRLIMTDYENSDLEKWLRKKRLSTSQFAQNVGCSRIVIWKAKRGIEIANRYAKKINELTLGEVCVKTRTRTV